MPQTVNSPFPSFVRFSRTIPILLLGLSNEGRCTSRADSGVQKPTGSTAEEEEFLWPSNIIFFLVDSNTIPLGIRCLIDSFEVKKFRFLGRHLNSFAAGSWFFSVVKIKQNSYGFYRNL